jgi:isoquinoline 1-oxidoreductase beta subunit
MLCRAAARRWGVDWQACDTKDGFVIHKANRLAFADVVADASAEDAPTSPTLRATPQLSGKPLLRLDIPSKTDGSARFGGDVRLPGMMYAAIRHDPFGATRTGVDRASLPKTVRLVEGPDFIAVVADGWYAAKTALEELKPAYKAAAKPPGPWLETELKAALAGVGTVVKDEGDVALASAKGAVSADYSLPFLAHACLEPMTATVRIDDGKVEVWAPTQSLTLSRWAAARALGVADEMVTVYPTLLGGGFGRKVEADAAALAFGAQPVSVEAGFQQGEVAVVRTAEIAQALSLADLIDPGNCVLVRRAGGGAFCAHCAVSRMRTGSPVSELMVAETILTSTIDFTSVSGPSKWTD